MNKKMKIMTIVGTRPEIIRLSRIIRALDINFNHILVHTGQNYDYELNEIFFEDLEINLPNYFLNASMNNASTTIGNLIIKVDKILDLEKPDAILILGDTNSCLSSIPAKKRKIPIFHMEAGNRCFDNRVPEEINRKLVDHISDINITYSTLAKNNLINEGIHPKFIIKLGSPMKEVLDFYSEKIKNSNILEQLNFKKKMYFVFSFHREENVENEFNFKKFVEIIKTINKKFNIPVFLTAHPRTFKKINENKIQFGKNILISKPVNFSDYINLQINSKCVLSDSGTIFEETSILNLNSINLRENHERPEALEESSVIMSGLNINNILNALEFYETNETFQTLVYDYKDVNISEKIVKVLLSHVDFINREVWKKNT